MSELLYHTVQVDMRALRAKWSRRSGPSARGTGVGAAAELLQKAIVKLGGMALDHRIKKELEKIEPKVERVMPAAGGVLVRVTTKEWKYPDPTGAKAKGFLGVGIAETGRTPQDAIRKWYLTPRLMQGAPKGWVAKDKFLWVTRKKTNKNN